MKQLNRQIPFVNQVFAYIENKVDAQSCIDILTQSEKKWEVEHIAPTLEVYIDNFSIKTKKPKKFAHIIGLSDDEKDWGKYVIKNYFGFLSETNMVFDTTYYSDQFDIILSNKFSFQATARSWGEMYSKWANKINWLGKKNWKYLDFYALLANKIEDFDVWSKAAFEILTLKTKQKS